MCFSQRNRKRLQTRQVRQTRKARLHRHAGHARHQSGFALITALIFLVVMTLIGISLMTGSSTDERMASNAQQRNQHLQIADSAIQKMFNEANVFVLGETISATHPYYDGSTPDGEPPRPLVTYEKDAGVETGIGASNNPALIWEAGEYSRYYFNMRATAQSASGAQTTVAVGAMAVGKGS